MAALAFLLAVLIANKVRRRVFIIGGTFILVSGLVYFLFISAWFNLFQFLGYVQIINLIVAIAVIIFAIFMLREYFMGIICKLCHISAGGKEGFATRMERKLLAKMEQATAQDVPLYLTLLVTAIVAAGINMVELFCSFGLPLAYTKVLTTMNLSTLTYYLNLIVYVAMYMIDDFLIFVIAVVTMRATGVSEKYLGAIKFISAVIMFALGLWLLFKVF